MSAAELLREAHDAIEAFRNTPEPFECVDFTGVWVEVPEARAKWEAALKRLDAIESAIEWARVRGEVKP